MNHQQSYMTDHAPRINARRAREAALQKMLNHVEREEERRVSYCVNWLESQGFNVLNIERGQRITVRYSPLCDQLEGAVSGFCRSLKGELRYKSVWRHDCEVIWLMPSGKGAG